MAVRSFVLLKIGLFVGIALALVLARGAHAVSITRPIQSIAISQLENLSGPSFEDQQSLLFLPTSGTALISNAVAEARTDWNATESGMRFDFDHELYDPPDSVTYRAESFAFVYFEVDKVISYVFSGQFQATDSATHSMYLT